MEGLIPSDLASRADLDLAELENVTDARLWAAGRRWTIEEILDIAMVRELHRRMFGQVWRWAGEWRRRETNLGLAPHVIAVEVRNVLDDARTWSDCTTFPVDEIALRAHHRLVLVHPFQTGNGRHARLIADLLARALGAASFRWSGDHLGPASAIRDSYLASLQALDRDRDDIGPLLGFARGSRDGTT